MKNILAILGAATCLAACANMGNDSAAEAAGMDMGGSKITFQDSIDYIPSALGSYEWSSGQFPDRLRASVNSVGIQAGTANHANRACIRYGGDQLRRIKF